MKNLYRISVILILLIALSCSKSEDKSNLESKSITLNYDSSLVDSVVNLTPKLKVAKLKGWEIDVKATEEKEDMIYFNNSKHHGMITTKVYDDGKFSTYLQEIIKTFEGHDVVSEEIFTFKNKIYHKYILKSAGFTIIKTLIEFDEKKYLDINFLLVESKYPRIEEMIDTYLASIATLN